MKKRLNRLMKKHHMKYIWNDIKNLESKEDVLSYLEEKGFDFSDIREDNDKKSCLIKRNGKNLYQTDFIDEEELETLILEKGCLLLNRDEGGGL